MKLVEFKDWKLTVPEEVWGLAAFKALLDRDKSKNKETAHQEMLFIFHYCDVRSNYNFMMDKELKAKEIAHDIQMPEDWAIDIKMQAAIDTYSKLSQTVVETLYKQALIGVSVVGEELENSKELIKQLDKSGKPIYDMTKLLNAIEKVPKVMKSIKAAYAEVVEEKESASGKNIGSQEKNPLEDMLNG